MLPLFAKYRTLSGNRYAYDVQTGQILRVSDVVYEILDDYRVLTPDEICRKHPALDEEAVQESLGGTGQRTTARLAMRPHSGDPRKGGSPLLRKEA